MSTHRRGKLSQVPGENSSHFHTQMYPYLNTTASSPKPCMRQGASFRLSSFVVDTRPHPEFFPCFSPFLSVFDSFCSLIYCFHVSVQREFSFIWSRYAHRVTTTRFAANQSVFATTNPSIYRWGSRTAPRLSILQMQS